MVFLILLIIIIFLILLNFLHLKFDISLRFLFFIFEKVLKYFILILCNSYRLFYLFVIIFVDHFKLLLKTFLGLLHIFYFADSINTNLVSLILKKVRITFYHQNIVLRFWHPILQFENQRILISKV